jgi:hypothetical protein
MNSLVARFERGVTAPHEFRGERRLADLYAGSREESMRNKCTAPAHANTADA